MNKKFWKDLNYIQSPRTDRVLRLVYICIIIGLCTGIILNESIMALHDGKMPIKDLGNEYSQGTSVKHFIYKDGHPSLLADWIHIDTTSWSTESAIILYFADILTFPLGKTVLASPGDFLIWIFKLLGTVLQVVLVLYILYRTAKKILNQNRHLK